MTQNVHATKRADVVAAEEVGVYGFLQQIRASPVARMVAIGINLRLKEMKRSDTAIAKEKLVDGKRSKLTHGWLVGKRDFHLRRKDLENH